MLRCTLLAALLASAASFNHPASMLPRSRAAVSRVQPAAVRMEEPSDKAVIVGAAAVGGIFGVYFFHELGSGILWACILAYGATMSNSFGGFSKSAGSTASKVYSKATELNDEYDVLPKVKTAADVVTTAAGNLNDNYGITDNLDRQLKISAAVDKVVTNVEGIKDSVTGKVSELKSKASSK